MNQSTDLANTLRHVRPDDLNLLLEHWDFMNALFVKPGALGIAEIISGIKTPGKAMLLLYRSHPGNGGLVFAPLINALHVGFTHIAIQSAHTWEDFKRMVPNSELSRLEESFADSDDPPTDDDDFDPEWLSGYYDGDYPMWLQSYMHMWIPGAILNRFGKCKNTHLNGDYYEIPNKNEAAICAALKDAGLEVLHARRLPFR